MRHKLFFYETLSHWLNLIPLLLFIHAFYKKYLNTKKVRDSIRRRHDNIVLRAITPKARGYLLIEGG